MRSSTTNFNEEKCAGRRIRLGCPGGNIQENLRTPILVPGEPLQTAYRYRKSWGVECRGLLELHLGLGR